MGLHSHCSLAEMVTAELSPSWEAARHSDTQEFPYILWKPKFNYRVHTIPLLLPILSQMNPVHITPSYFSNAYFNIIRLPTCMSS
jgi:hypothetical protein